MASQPLKGRRVGFVMANEGVEEVELTRPWKAVQESGGTCCLLAPRTGDVQAFNHLDKGTKFPVDIAIADTKVDEFDALVLPGGVANPDQLRLDAEAVAFVGAFVESNRVVAAICHAPWTLVEADKVRGRTLTSWPSLRTDIENGGGRWIDKELVVEGQLLTSRGPKDLDVFSRALVDRVTRSSRHRAA